MLKENFKRLFSFNSTRIDESAEDKMLDFFTSDEKLREEVKKMTRITLVGKYIETLSELNTLKEKYELLFTENKLTQEKELKATNTAEEIRKKHEPQINEIEFRPKWTWINKIVFIITRNNRPMKSTEIMAVLLECDEYFKKYISDNQKHLSFYLNRAAKYHRIHKYKINGVRGYYYILPEWLKGDKLTDVYEKQIYIYK